MKYGCQKKGTGKAVLKAATGVMALASPMLQHSPLAFQAKLFQQNIPVSKQRINVPDVRIRETREDKIKKESAKMKKGGMPPRKSKYFRKTESGAGMTQEGVMAYRRKNPGSKLKTAVTESNPGPKRAARRKSFCARSAGQMKMFPKAAKDPNSRLRQARRRWKC